MYAKVFCQGQVQVQVQVYINIYKYIYTQHMRFTCRLNTETQCKKPLDYNTKTVY